MDLSDAPVLSRNEKLVMRSSDRKDIFAEKFNNLSLQQFLSPGAPVGRKPVLQHKTTNSNDSYSSFEEGLFLKGKDRNAESKRKDDTRYRTESSLAVATPPQNYNSPSDSSFSLGGSAVWVGDESGLDLLPKDKLADAGSISSTAASTTIVASSRNRRSTDASSSSSHTQSRDHALRPLNHQPHEQNMRPSLVKDTHFYHTTVAYKDHQLPIKMPLSTFPEEVGDVRLFTHYVEFNPTDNVLTVLSDHSDQDLLGFPPGGRACSPSSSFKRTSNPSHNRSFQCPCDRKTNCLPWSQTTCW